MFGDVEEPLDLALGQGHLPEVDIVQDLSNLRLGDVLWHEQNWMSGGRWGKRGEQTPEVGRDCAEDNLHMRGFKNA